MTFFPWVRHPLTVPAVRLLIMYFWKKNTNTMLLYLCAQQRHIAVVLFLQPCWSWYTQPS